MRAASPCVTTVLFSWDVAPAAVDAVVDVAAAAAPAPPPAPPAWLDDDVGTAACEAMQCWCTAHARV